ncbi:hypothetical protein WMY93_004521 [Mugilogobius chulae]|uniref:PH domain-containing protein n=1 Tax=Mugilogobius chulae TaxID=88201 RepID=A0AAW0PNR2_9GOBI
MLSDRHSKQISGPLGPSSAHVDLFTWGNFFELNNETGREQLFGSVLARLLWDLQTFLSLLESENLSFIAQAQKKSLSELLTTLQSTATTTGTTTAAVEDAEYMVMSCPATSPTETNPHGPAPDRLSQLLSKRETLKNSSKTLNEKAESDSSHYESYGEDDDDVFEGGAGLMTDRRFVQWSASQPCLRPAPESRLCGYLWRRKWLGQWTKQLFIIRNHSLMCYKCSRDPEPQMELDLRGCFLLYKSKPQRKVPHTLRLVLPGSECLVLGFSSYQHADEWRKVIEELSSGEIETQSASVIRTEPLSCRSSAVQTDSDDERSSAPQRPLQDRGFLSVLMNCQWQSLRCEVESGVLNMFAHRDQDRGGTPQYTLSLIGCEVTSGPDTPHSYRITLSTLTDTLAVLEVSSAEEKEHWIKLLKDSANRRAESSPPEDSASLSGLQTRRFPSPNTYETQAVYSNSSVLQHQLHKDSSRDTGTYGNTSVNQRKGVEQRSVQKLELAGKPANTTEQSLGHPAPSAPRVRTHETESAPWWDTFCAQVRRESAPNETRERTSLRLSLAICTERAQMRQMNVPVDTKKSAQMRKKKGQGAARAHTQVRLESAPSGPKECAQMRQEIGPGETKKAPRCSKRVAQVRKESAQSSFLTPLLRRTASAKLSLKRAPSVLFLESDESHTRRRNGKPKLQPKIYKHQTFNCTGERNNVGNTKSTFHRHKALHSEMVYSNSPSPLSDSSSPGAAQQK